MTTQQELIPVSAGERLKQHRRAKKLGLSAVSKAIGLDEKVLEAIEEDRAGHMALVYRNGYIRSYARYLKVPEDKITLMLDLSSNNEPALQPVFMTPVKRNPVDNWLRATSYVLASLLIGTLAWQFTHEAVRLTQNGSSLQTTRVEQSGNSTNTSMESNIGSPVNASIASLDHLNHKQPDVALSAIPDTSETELPSAELPTGELLAGELLAGQSELQVSVSADSWVEITDALGLDLEMDLLRAGSTKRYLGTPPFKLVFGRASAVKLSMDGEPVDLAPFTKADVVQMAWPPLSHAANKIPGETTDETPNQN